MRVTKTVKEYIEKEVEKRLLPKYEKERNEAQRRRDAKDEIVEKAIKAAETAFLTTVEEGLKKEDYATFIDFSKKSFFSCNHYNFISLKEESSNEEVFRWATRLKKEKEEISKEIIVELELGGTKETLIKLLEAI